MGVERQTPRRIAFKDIYASGPHYSRGVRAGNMLFLSGCTANQSDAEHAGPMEHLRVVLERITRMVQAEGGTPADIVKVTTFVANTDDWFPFGDRQIAVFSEFFGDAYPANTMVGAVFPTSNVHVEIDAIAVLASDG